ncbi:hypothetical protein NMY22_g720 [Coprinellus aureogranulatus]|nr:hypothetical protein NMY22_g720 [Coprinellus aureogranulatus]
MTDDDTSSNLGLLQVEQYTHLVRKALPSKLSQLTRKRHPVSPRSSSAGSEYSLSMTEANFSKRISIVYGHEEMERGKLVFPAVLFAGKRPRTLSVTVNTTPTESRHPVIIAQVQGTPELLTTIVDVAQPNLGSHRVDPRVDVQDKPSQAIAKAPSPLFGHTVDLISRSEYMD